MSKYLLLLDRRQCPSCRTKNVPSSLPAKCRKCGIQLFKDTDQTKKFIEETGIRELWVFCWGDGWKHSTMLNQKALERVYEIHKLPSNYGTPEFVRDKISDSRAELRAALKRKKKGKVFAIGSFPQL